MEAYTSFAQVYDTFMDNVPYEDWSDRIRRSFASMASPEAWPWILAAVQGR